MIPSPRQEAVYDFLRNSRKNLAVNAVAGSGKNIVLEAQKIVPHIQPWDQAEEGEVNEGKTFNSMGIDPDTSVVLCRTTAPLVSACLEMIRKDKPAHVKGKNIGKDLSKLADKIFKFSYTASAV